jgi:SCY1-like protein 1
LFSGDAGANVIIRLVRDQANKTFDAYLQRVRKFGTTLPDTVLPPPGSSETSTTGATRIGTQNDTSWAGWAISSFTNKMTTAKGEMQSSTNGVSTKPNEPRSTSMPPPSATAPIATRTTVAENFTLGRSSTPDFARTSSDQYFGGPSFDDEEVDDAWGNMDEDSFFDAPAEQSASRNPRSPTKPVAFDDGGEPDFAGWLTAQAKAKSKKPLPKGLGKAKETVPSRPAGGPRSSTTGSVGSGTATKKLASAVVKPKHAATTKKIETKPKEETAEDDGWGDAWD